MTEENVQHPINEIDWHQLWRELDWDNDKRREAAIQQRLRQRAEQYAAPIHDSSDVQQARTVLVFDLGKETYGIDVMVVRTVRTIEKITPVPGTPRFYRGVVNIRGKIITVLDLRIFLDMNVDVQDMPTELIVVNINALAIGLLVHHARDVARISEAMIEPLDDIRYARGITEGRIILLDAIRMFEDERLIVGGLDE